MWNLLCVSCCLWEAVRKKETETTTVYYSNYSKEKAHEASTAEKISVL